MTRKTTPQPRHSNRSGRAIPKALTTELERPRLLALLDRAKDLKLVALIAPTGYGKTTVLAQYARGLNRRVIWLDLFEDSADPRFLSALLANGLGFIPAALELLASHPTSVIAPEALAGCLDQAEQNVTLILENVHRLGVDASKWLHRFVLALAEGHGVLISGYEAGAIPLARYVSQGSALALGVPELAFSSEESAEYLRLRAPALDPETLHRSLEGWCAGMALAASGAPLGLSPGDLVLGVLNTLPKAVRAGIAEMAILEVWSEEAARQLGAKLSKGWLGKVQRAGLPIAPLGAGKYRPHLLVLETLEQELKVNPVRHSELHTAAALQAESDQQPLDALKHYQLAGSQSQALRVASEVANKYSQRWEFRLVRQVLELFRESELPQDLLEFLGGAYIETGEATKGEALLRGLHSSGKRTSALGFRLAAISERRGNYQDMLGFAQESVSFADNDRDRMGGIRMLGAANLELGLLQEARQLTHSVIDWAKAKGELPLLGAALTQLGNILEVLDDTRGMQNAFAQAVDVYRAFAAPGRLIIPLFNLANNFRILDQLDLGFEAIDEAIAIAERESHSMIIWALYMRGLLFQHRADHELAIHDFKTALARCPEFGIDFFAAKLRFVLAWSYFNLGEYKQAIAFQEAVFAESDRFGESLETFIRILNGLKALESSNLVLSDESFEYLENHETEPIYVARVLLYRAEIARRQNVLNQEHALKLERQFQKIGNSGFLRIDAAKLHLLYREFVFRGWVVEHFQPHLEPNSSLPAQQMPTLELKVKSFGALQVRINDSRVHIPLAKAGELLVWLILNGAATRDEIVRALWGDPNEQRHVEYFKICVRRLRASLGETVKNINPLPFENNLYGLHEQLAVHCDALQLTRIGESENLESLRAALDAARGGFLSASDAEWVQNARAQFHEQLLAGYMTLGRLLESHDLLEAATVYQRAIKLEPLHEIAYLALIRVFQEFGQVTKAREAYSRYAQMLREEFGRSPKLELQMYFVPSGTQPLAQA
jgi:LuxR family transcriptional regulator, maltose regulon positive regulatory protein